MSKCLIRRLFLEMTFAPLNELNPRIQQIRLALHIQIIQSIEKVLRPSLFIGLSALPGKIKFNHDSA